MGRRSPFQRGGRASQAMTAAVLREYGLVCHLCLQPGADTRDHLVPLSKGGRDTIENCRPAHRRCNSRRQARDLTPALYRLFRPEVREINVKTSEFFESATTSRKPRNFPSFTEPHTKTDRTERGQK